MYNLDKYDKIIFFDSETFFPHGTKQGDTKFINPSLRFMQWRYWDGEKMSETFLRDAYYYDGDPWKEIRDLMSSGFRLLAHNGLLFDFSHSLVNYKTEEDWILPYLIKGQIWDTLIVEKLINGMNPTKDIERFDEMNDKKDIIQIEEEELEESEDGVKMGGFSLKALMFKYFGMVMDKKFQDWKYYIPPTDHGDSTIVKDFITYDIVNEAISKNEKINGVFAEACKYALDDVEYLPDLYSKQKEQIKRLSQQGINVMEAIDLSHQLGATTYIAKKWGIAINTKDLDKYRSQFKEELIHLQNSLEEKLPKVPITRPKLIDLYLNIFWKPKELFCGLKTKKEATDLLKNNRNHVIVSSFDNWVNSNRKKLVQPVKLGNPKHVKQSLNELGIPVHNTSFEVLKDYSIKNEVPIIDTLLKYKENYALLSKTLDRISPQYYLRPDNTVSTTYNFNGPTNWRSSSRNMNAQNCPRSLKSIFGTPSGMYNITFDLSAVELVKVMDKAKPKLALESMNAKDQHLFFAAMYYDRDFDKLYEAYINGDPEAKILRQSSKTVTFMNIYKSPCPANGKYVIGRKKLQEIFKTELDMDIDDDRANKLILNCERVFDSWTDMKRQVEEFIKQKYWEGVNQGKREELLFTQLRGPLGHLAKFNLVDLYSAENNYTNARSLFSVMIAGPIAVGVKSAIRSIQEFLYWNYKPDNARLTLTVHDSNSVYFRPEYLKDLKPQFIDRFLTNVYKNGAFDFLNVAIEGMVQDEQFNQIDDEGLIMPAIYDDKGKRKYKEEKYVINKELVISRVK